MMKKLLPIFLIAILVFSSIGATSIKINEKKTDNDVSATETDDEYDLLIIAPSEFNRQLQRLVDHKKSVNIDAKIVNVKEIYNGKYFPVEGRDPPEKIKYFIKNAMENWNISYVLLVGGLKYKFYANPRENLNYGAKHWYVPVRYTNVYDEPEHPLVSKDRTYDPGVISDLYYADIYDKEDNFSSWDPNEDGIFAAWNFKFNETDDNVEDDLDIDLEPDIALGRLPCRTRKEVKIVVDKIINYETATYGQEWFKKMTVIAGDGFLDQKDLDFQWNTSNCPKGYYTICAQSFREDKFGQLESGNIDSVIINLKKTGDTSINVTHDDHLQNPDFIYPALPIAEITVPSTGDSLGSQDLVDKSDNLAYGNDFLHWTDINFTNDIMHIRGKSYDPQPYGNLTNINVWVENEENETVFSEWRNNTEIYYEGEWVTGEKVLKGRGGALYYMPNDFKKDIVWASNGRLTGVQDVLNAFNKGTGFVFMSGHGSPNVWADHYPGVPGDRAHASIDGLAVTNLKLFSPYIELPLYPMNKLSNKEKLPIVVIGGCHNSQFNISFAKSVGHGIYKIYFKAIEKFVDSHPILQKFLPGLIHSKDTKMWTYGSPISECFSWRLVSLQKGGAIATIGNTGLGYGRLGKNCTSGGGDAWITTEMFKQYGTNGYDILGDAFMNAQKSYISNPNFNMSSLPDGHAKTVQQLILFGDPTLKIGGYKN